MCTERSHLCRNNPCRRLYRITFEFGAKIPRKNCHDFSLLFLPMSEEQAIRRMPLWLPSWNKKLPSTASDFGPVWTKTFRRQHSRCPVQTDVRYTQYFCLWRTSWMDSNPLVLYPFEATPSFQCNCHHGMPHAHPQGNTEFRSIERRILRRLRFDCKCQGCSL